MVRRTTKISLSLFLVGLFVFGFAQSSTGSCPETMPEGMVYCEDFESVNDYWKDNFLSFQVSNIAVTENNPHSGQHSIRSNLIDSAIDPMTGLNGVTNIQWVPGNILSSLKSKYGKAYIKYWVRLDVFDWEGSEGNNDAVGKLAYIMDESVGVGAYYFGSWDSQFAYNGAWYDWYSTEPYPWGTYYDNPRIGFYFDSSAPKIRADGIWHSVEVYVNYELEMMNLYFDGTLIKGSNSNGISTDILEGNIPIPPQFNFSGLHFFFVRDNEVDLSTNLVSGEYAAGWQIDDIQIWDGLPNNTAPACGDGTCNGIETCATCSDDCGQCRSYGLSDFIALQQVWLTPGDQSTDINQDNVVNARDLGIMMSSWE